MEIKTLFKPKDTIFFLNDSVVQEKQVLSIVINVYDTHHAVNYEVDMSKPGQSTMRIRVPEVAAFGTVEDLGKSVIESYIKHKEN